MSRDQEDSKIDTRYNLKVYWSVLRNYKRYLLGILLFVFLIESGHIFDRFLFKVVIDKGTEFVAGNIARDAYSQILLMVMAVFIASFLVKAVIRWFNLHFINTLEGEMILDIKKKFLNHLVHLSYNFHTTHKTGSLISKLIRSGGAVERMTDVLAFNLFPLLFQLIVVMASIIYFDAISAAIILVTCIVFVIYSLFMSKKMQKANVESNDQEDYEKAQISDIFTNIESIKLYGKENNVKQRYFGIGTETKRLMVRAWNFYRWQTAGHSVILGIGTIMIMYFPLVKVLEGSLSVGTLVFIYTVYLQLLQYLFGFDHGIRAYYRSMADFQSLFKFYKIENDIKDLPEAKNLEIIDGVIEFKQVSFRYKDRTIFDKFTLLIPKEKKVAIIGPSGAGKTSLIRLLYRLYDVEAGSILIDGQDVRSLKQESLRSELSIVPQECVLFDDTIYNNIAFSRPDATRDDVMLAMKFAQLDTIVDKFPNKENTVVGERGVKLSGGEKQRVSIARAILANKKILVLDEATSSLDSETESEIQKDLHRLMKGRTSIIIAHRLSTIMSADMIVVMDKGRVVQKGTHKQLIKKKGLYKKLWELQKGGYLESQQ